MRTTRTCITFIWIALEVASVVGRVRAQTRDQDAAPPPGSAAETNGEAIGTTPPRLVLSVDVSYPEAVSAQGREVLLQLLVSATGTVDEVTVIESAGAAVDDAVVAAVRQFRFEPALRGKTAVAALIRYRFVLEDANPVLQSEEQVQPASVSPAAETSALRARAAAPPSPAERATETPVFGATAEVSAPAREPTRHTLQSEQLNVVPGARGDALRAVEILPGVGRTAFAENDGPPILRGVSPSNSVVLLDGAPVPSLFHFGGLTSFFNSQLLEAVDVYPSNVSARYGRLTGGMVQARVLRRNPQQVQAKLELSLIDSWALVQAPVGPATSVALGARRSNIDLVFEQLVPEDTFTVLSAPVYYDYQALLRHEPSPRQNLRVLVYGARDTLKLVFSEPNADDPALRDELEGLFEFHRVQAHWTSRLSRSVEQQLMVSVGPQKVSQRLGSLDAELNGLDLHARSDWSFFSSSTIRVDTGFDLFSQFFSGHYLGPKPPQTEGDPSIDDRIGAERLHEVAATFHVFRPAAYAELAYRPLDALSILPGVRFDYYEEFNDWTIDPRLTLREQLSERTVIKSGVGLYSQPPEYYQQLKELGNPELEPQRSAQFSLGVEHQVGQQLSLKSELFYQRLFHRIVSTVGGAPPNFENDGSGRIGGLEVLAEIRPSRRSFGYLAYTLARSERRDRDEPFRLFDRDQTHNLSVTGSYELGRGWLAGARFRFVSGNPFTPVTGTVYDATTDVYRPLYRPVNSERRSAFHQLDLRVEKHWRLGNASLTAYLELLNAYNAKNVEGYRYSYNYRISEGVTGLPIFPNVGLRGEL